MTVTVYVSGECGASREAVAYFMRMNVSVRIVNVRADRRLLKLMLAKGGIATPFITIGDQTFHSFDANRFDRLLGRLYG